MSELTSTEISLNASVWALRRAIEAIADLGGCMEPDCTEPNCWIGGASDVERAAASTVIWVIQREA